MNGMQAPSTTPLLPSNPRSRVPSLRTIRALQNRVGRIRGVDGVQLHEQPDGGLTIGRPYDGPFAVQASEGGTKVKVGQGPIHAGTLAYAWFPAYYQTTDGITDEKSIPTGTPKKLIVWMKLSVDPTYGDFRGIYIPQVDIGPSVSAESHTGIGHMQTPVGVEVPLAYFETDGSKIISSSIWQIHYGHIQVYVHKATYCGASAYRCSLYGGETIES